MKRNHRITLFIRHHWLITALLSVTLIIAGWLAWYVFPANEQDMRRSVCMVEGQWETCLVADSDTIVLYTDTVHQQGVWVEKCLWWLCGGVNVLTVWPKTDNAGTFPRHIQTDSMASYVSSFRDSVCTMLEQKRSERSELEYYLRSHGVQDEGYVRVAVYHEKQNEEIGALDSLCRQLMASKNRKNLHLIYIGRCHVSWCVRDGKWWQEVCRPVIINADSLPRTLMLRTASSQKPSGTYAVRQLPWAASQQGEILSVTLTDHDVAARQSTIIMQGELQNGKYQMPRLFAGDGCAIFTRRGQFVGVVSGDSIMY